MSSYPHAPAIGKTDTSAAAAEAIEPVTARLQRLALRAIGAAPNGLTSEELARLTDVACAAIQPRTTELRLLGKIIDSGLRRLNASGKAAIVWKVRGA